MLQEEETDTNPFAADADHAPPKNAPLQGIETLFRTPSGTVGILSFTPHAISSAQFMIGASTHPFQPGRIPAISRPSFFNSDFAIGSIRTSKLIWSGEQRLGTSTHAGDTISITDHLMKGLLLEFFLENDTPLPAAIQSAIDFTVSTPFSTQVDFRTEQMDKVEILVDQSSKIQEQRYKNTDPG